MFYAGAVECKAIGCGPPRCERPVQVPGQCCPVCQGCEYRGRSYPEGQSFSNPQDRCEQCICQVREATLSQTLICYICDSVRKDEYVFTGIILTKHLQVQNKHDNW